MDVTDVLGTVAGAPPSSQPDTGDEVETSAGFTAVLAAIVSVPGPALAPATVPPTADADTASVPLERAVAAVGDAPTSAALQVRAAPVDPAPATRLAPPAGAPHDPPAVTTPRPRGPLPLPVPPATAPALADQAPPSLDRAAIDPVVDHAASGPRGAVATDPPPPIPPIAGHPHDDAPPPSAAVETDDELIPTRPTPSPSPATTGGAAHAEAPATRRPPRLDAPGTPGEHLPVLALHDRTPIGEPVGTAPMPVERPLVAQLVERLGVLRQHDDGEYELTLQLEPAELGRLELRVRLESGTVHLHVGAQSRAASDLLRSALPELRDALLDAGLSAGHLDVGQQSTARHGDPRPAAPLPGVPPEPGPRPDAPTIATRPIHRPDVARGVDVLL